MTPSKIQVAINKAAEMEITGYEAEDYIRLFQLSGIDRSAVYWDGLSFGVCSFHPGHPNKTGNTHVAIQDKELYGPVVNNRPIHGGNVYLHYPVDPRITELDVVGATIAFANETNDGWLFAHCDDDFMHDHEVSLEDVAISVFQVEINKLQIDANTKLAALVKSPANSSTSSQELAARVKLNSLNVVLEHLLACIEKEARKRYVGYYHQNPDKSHLHQEVHDCLSSLVGLNKLTQTVEYIQVSTELDRILAKLRDKHNYKYRWVLADEAKKEAARREAESQEE